MERPPARPEGALIRVAREAAGLTLPEAAEASGVSKARWSQVETGYETRNGHVKVVQAKAATIAHMAHAVRLSPDRLESEGKRPDAAEILREILRTLPAPVRATPGQVPGHLSPSVRDTGEIPIISADPEYVDEVWGEVSAAKGVYGLYPDGAQVFPADVHEAGIWDNNALPEDLSVRLIAFIRMMNARYQHGSNGRRAS